MIKCNTMKIEIAIENGRSLKLRWKSILSHLLRARNPPRMEATQPANRLQGGLGVGREGRDCVEKERRSRRGIGLPGKHNHPTHHTTSLTIPAH